MSAADVVLTDAMQDRSFAGLFPYSNNGPMKVFAGNEPSVPVSVLVDALDSLQAGSGSKGAAKAMHVAAAAHEPCMAACSAHNNKCMKSGKTQSECARAAQMCKEACHPGHH